MSLHVCVESQTAFWCEWISTYDFMVICVIVSHLQMCIQVFAVCCDILRICWSIRCEISHYDSLRKKSKFISQCDVKSNIKLKRTLIIKLCDDMMKSFLAYHVHQVQWIKSILFEQWTWNFIWNLFSPFICHTIEWNSHKQIVCLLRDVIQCLINVIQTLRHANRQQRAINKN